MLAALTLGWAVIYADRTSMYPLLSVIAEQYSLSSAQVGTVTSIYFLFYVLMQVPAGIIGDKYGLRRILIVMYFLAGIGLLGMGTVVNSYGSLLFFAAIHGLGAGAYYPAAYGTTLQTVPIEKKGISSAIIGMGMALGLLLGLAMSGPVYEVVKDFRIPFLILSVPTFLMTFYFYKKVPNVKSVNPPSWSQFKEILSNRNLWLINISTFCALYGFWVAITWGPTYLKVERGFSLGQAGFLTGLIAVMAVPASLLWGKMSDRYSRKAVAVFLLPASGFCLLLLSFVKSQAAIVIVLLLLGVFTNSAFTPIMVAWTGDLVSKCSNGSMGAAIGVFNSVIMFSAIIAPAVSGFIRDVTGSLRSAIIFGGLIMIIGTGLIYFINSDE